MSPRRLVDPTDRDYFAAPASAPKRPRRWGLPVTAVVSALLAIAAIVGCVFAAVNHESVERTKARDAAALENVTSFMVRYTSLDPFNANQYVDDILGQATGEFATSFKERSNEIVIQVARTEPTKGDVLAAGVERWNANGSADVLVAANVTTPGRDGRPTVESASRWVATTIEEGEQWKISKLVQVI